MEVFSSKAYMLKAVDTKVFLSKCILLKSHFEMIDFKLLGNIFFLILDKNKIPFIDLTHLAKKYLKVSVTLVCDCYLYQLDITLLKLEKMIVNFVKSFEKKKCFFLPNWAKEMISSKFFIVGIDDFSKIKLQKIIINSINFESSAFFKKIVIFFTLLN